MSEDPNVAKDTLVMAGLEVLICDGAVDTDGDVNDDVNDVPGVDMMSGFVGAGGCVDDALRTEEDVVVVVAGEGETVAIGMSRIRGCGGCKEIFPPTGRLSCNKKGGKL